MKISAVQAGLLLDLIRLGRDMYREHKNSVVEGLPDVEGEITLEQYALLPGNEIFANLFDGRTPEQIGREIDSDPVDEGKEDEDKEKA